MDENGEEKTLCDLAVQAGGERKAMVLDFWHTKCVKCPAALEKLNDEAGSGEHDGIVFVSCALSQGAGNKDVAMDMISGEWGNLLHVFMEIEVKEQAKAAFGFAAVPFYVVVDRQGNVVGSGDPKTVDFVKLLADTKVPSSAAAASSSATIPEFKLDEDF